jgi:hypothetical protein
MLEELFQIKFLSFNINQVLISLLFFVLFNPFELSLLVLSLKTMIGLKQQFHELILFNFRALLNQLKVAIKTVIINPP